MTTLKIVHAADFHLGSLFASTPSVATRRRLDQIDALQKTVNLCAERNADVLLIAGDLFDCPRVDPALLAQVKDILTACTAKVFITPGNHDPATPDSCYADDNWPSNVHIFRGALECVRLENKTACIWGAGFTRSHQLEPLVSGFTPVDDCVNILCMHGELVGSTGESRYNPVIESRLPSLGADYVALGHIHKTDMRKAGDFMYGYCGIPEPRGFDEPGEHGVYCGNVGKGFAYVDFVPLASRKYITDVVDVSGCSIVSEFAQSICTALEKRYGESYGENLYSLTLRGELPRGIMVDNAAVVHALEDKLCYVRLTDTTSTELDIEALGKDTTLRGAFTRAICSRMARDEANRDKYMRALLFGLRAFDGEVRINEDN